MKSKKNVLIILPHLIGKGGVAQYWRNLKPFYDSSHEFNFYYFQIGSNKKQNLHIIKDQLRLNDLLKNKDFDFVHLNPSLNYKSIARDCLFIKKIRKFKIPFMVTFHGWNPKIEKQLRTYFPFILKSTFLKSSYILVLSEEFKKNILNWGFKNGISVETTCIGNDLLDGFNIQQKIEKFRNSDCINILYISRIVKLKGVLETIKAIEILGYKFNVKLNIAGVGPYLDQVKDYVRTKKISNVKFMGYVQGDNKLNLFYNSHILCFPSIYPEGLPVTIMEAIATGCALITTPNAGIKDIFIENKMGLFCNNKPHDIASKIKNLLNSGNLQKVMEFNNNHGHNYSAKFVYSRLIKIYKSVF